MNGDFSNGNGDAGKLERSIGKLFYYVLESEFEQQAFLQLREVVRISIEGTIEEIEHARNKGNFDAKLLS